jgi:hypothetical protein
MMSDDPVKIDQFHRHEVLHTTHIVSAMFEDHVATHAYTLSDPEVLAAAEKVSAALADLYLLVGQKHLTSADQV